MCNVTAYFDYYHYYFRERRLTGHAVVTRSVREEAQADPHRVLALSAAAPGASLRQEPLCSRSRTQTAREQPQSV